MAFAVLLVPARIATAQQDPSAGRPAEWLPTTGHDEGWIKATARCRELLGKLKPDDPLVKRYLPNIQDKAGLLRRTQSFDWKKRTAIDFLQNMLTDVIAGAEPNKRYAGKGIGFPYWSEALNRVEAIWLHVPPGYDPAKKYQLFMYYKCGGGIHYKDGKAHGGYRPSVEVANQTDTFHAWSSLHIQVKGRMNADTELMEAIPAMAKEFSVDPDRVFLSGWSDGGFTAIWLASRHPHLVAGIAPNCANWQYTNVNQVGLFNVPFLVVDGWTDGGYVSRNFSRWHALHTMGYEVAGIWGHHGHAYTPYEDVAEFKQILDWAKTKRRNLHPKRVRYATWNLSWHRAYWLTIQRMSDPSLAAQVDAEIKEGNRIEVKAWNVAAYKLSLSEKLVDTKKPVTVVTNGKQSYSGPFKKELAVEVVKLPEGKFVKSAEMPGGITAQAVRSYYGLNRNGGWRIAGRRWIWVRPTGGDEKVQALLKKWCPSWSKADTAVTEEDLAQCNLFLYGGPDVNKLTARIAGELPVKFAAGKFTVARKVYDRPGNCVKFIHPNPLNAGKYVIVYAFNDAATFAANGYSGLTGESTWSFRSGDCVVMGVPGESRKWGVETGSPGGKDYYIFDASWRPPDPTPLGELETPFDCTQILRLRADAAREASGADAAVIAGYTPGWNNWKLSLPAGAVTVHDIATTSMLPEYVTLGEVRGSSLRGMVSRAAASSVLTDKRDPSYRAGSSLVLTEIDPEKTYTVAMGYSGLPAYGVNYQKMPKIFFFTSPQEFLAPGHTSLSVRNMRQIPLEMTEAVASYVRKRKKVSPRPVCFDLTQYIMNPQSNAFGGCDWLHLGLDAAWPRPAGAGTVHRRYTLNLGLRAAEDPDLSPPRENSKKFLDVDLAARAGPVAVDFAALDKKLAVSAELAVRKFAITADEAGSFKLAGEDAGQGVIGRGVLVDLRLSNKAKHDVTGVLALAPMTMRRIHGGTWPDAREKGAYYVGYRDAIGARRKPPVHEDAALWVWDGPAPKVGRLSRKVGYNFGHVGIHRLVSVKAGGAASLPLLLVSVDKPEEGPDVSLSAVLDALKADIAKWLSPPAGKGG